MNPQERLSSKAILKFPAIKLTWDHFTRYYDLDMYVERQLYKIIDKSKNSLLLLGPRQTGKSTLIQHLNPGLTMNLADEATYLEFSRNPSELHQRLAGQPSKTVFIDEVQRLPSLLNTIQAILDEKKEIQFYLTGSSARKLKRGKANLLPGRIHTFHLGPLVSAELDHQLNTKQACETGTLPALYTESSVEERIKTLRSYASTYLKEEIQAEALTRNLEGFSRFLFVAAQWSGRFLDLIKLASESRINRQSAIRYFEILEDTLIVQRCPSFAKSERRRLIQHPKFYFFDTGVLNALLGNFICSEDRKGLLFEHLFFNQLVASAAAQDKEIRTSTYRTGHGAEVDFIVEFDNKVWAIELKASERLDSLETRGFKSFQEFYGKNHQPVVGYWGNAEKKSDDILMLPWQTLLRVMGL